MFRVSYWDVIRAMCHTWHGIVALLIGIVLPILAVLEFTLWSNPLLGAILVLGSIAYWVLIYVFMTWTIILAMFLGAFLSVIFGGFFR